MKTYVHLWHRLAELFIGWRCFRQNCIHFMFNILFSPKIVPFMRSCGKIWYSHAGHGWQYKMAHCAFNAGQLRQEYRNTLVIFNIYCLFAATMVTRTLSLLHYIRPLPSTLIHWTVFFSVLVPVINGTYCYLELTDVNWYMQTKLICLIITSRSKKTEQKQRSDSWCCVRHAYVFKMRKKGNPYLL